MKKTKKFVLFIGGPSCSGKTTVSKIIAGPDSRAKKINYYSAMHKTGKSAGWSNKKMLENWEELQMLFFERAVYPALKKHDSLIIDIHYSFQRESNPSTAFTKRVYPVNTEITLSVSKEFLERIKGMGAATGVFLIASPPKILYKRQAKDHKIMGVHLSPLSTIKVELEKEAELWGRMKKILLSLKTKFKAERFINIDKKNCKTIAEKIMRLMNEYSDKRKRDFRRLQGVF